MTISEFAQRLEVATDDLAVNAVAEFRWNEEVTTALRNEEEGQPVGWSEW